MKLVPLSLSIMLAIGSAYADDGDIVRKSMTPSPGNAPDVPAGYVAEAEHVFIDMMKFYVPSQEASGEVGTQKATEYFNIDEILIETHYTAQPLVGVYIYGPSKGFDDIGFTGHGKRDAYGAVSLDDGQTWKVTNLSDSAEDVSSDVCREDNDLIDLFGACESGGNYPGDVTNVFQATAGTTTGLINPAGMNTLAVWPSRYCSSGEPNYSLDTSNPERRLAIADYMDIDIGSDGMTQTNPSPDDLYLIDMFGVGGSQGSVNYLVDDDYEPNQKVGEVPYSCLWAARGRLVMGDDPRTDPEEQSYMRWFKAERLTSGTRDVNRIETKCVAGAGCAITWQEDPEGLRGGHGEGPGIGWSGAVANSQTDNWYAYISWEHFDLVQDVTDDGLTILTFQEYLDSDDTTKPQPAIPFSMPMRVTDNAKCNVLKPKAYCNGAAIDDSLAVHPQTGEPLPNPIDYGMVDMCASTVEILTGKDKDELKEICVTEYGMPLVGNVASTRPRLGLYGYDSDKDDLVDSAFVVFQAEESKGLGAFGFDDSGTACTPPSGHDNEPVTEVCTPFDEGKNLLYYSFNMELTGDNAGNFVEKTDLDSLLANLGSHGNQLNQPEVDWNPESTTKGEFYPVANTVDFWDFGDYNFEIYNTEIARRGSLLAQDIGKINKTEAKAKLIALPAWKQGVMNQGGPADVMVRRIIMPKGWSPSKAGNPYAFRNMACSKDGWLYGRGKDDMPENPNYPDGLCMDSAINLSATIPDTCTDTGDAGDGICPQVDFSQGTTFGVGDTNPVLRGKEIEEPNTEKVLTWHSCPAEFDTVSGETLDCTNDLRTDETTLFDQSWYNPLDVSKGHRGYIDGDFVMMLYAWSPNWRLNAKGSDRYELYIRRSFDGGETWTTLPSLYKHWNHVDDMDMEYRGDGTVTCETFRSLDTGTGDPDEPRVCNEYAAGAAEQARNVTQHKSMKITTLDPRYSPTASSIVYDGETGVESDWVLGEDEWDPSHYFIVYETGDNTTTDLGEPEPLDLFYSRAVMFGDNYQVWAEETDLEVCYPNDQHDVTDLPEELIGSGFCNEFDQVDQGTPGLEGSESSLEANPGGEFMYGVWAQYDHEAHESDAKARRVWWINDYISSNPDLVWTLPGTSGGQ